MQALTAVGQTLYENKENMDAFILEYNKTSAYASDDVVKACKAFFILLMNKEENGEKLTKNVNTIYDSIRKDINPRAKSFEFQLYTVAPTSQQQSLKDYPCLLLVGI